MRIRKAIVRLRGLLTYLWYRVIYGKAFSCAGMPKIRKDFNLVIEPGGMVTFGKGVFINNHCSFNCMNSVSIGDNCLFGESVKIYDHNHRFRDPDIPIAEQAYKIGEIEIGNNCWIGSNTIILRGVSIGDNVIIGAGCVIDADVPSRSIVRNHSVQNYLSW